MQLKEIKDGMLIHCKTREEAEQLVTYTDSDKEFVKCYDIGGHRFSIEDGKICGWRYIESCQNEAVTEFSDLVLADEPELTIKDVLKIPSEICHIYTAKDCKNCPFSDFGDCDFGNLNNTDEIINICKQWKADHQKKEPEVEWVDLCRVMEIKEDGSSACVHEEEIEKVLPFGGYEKDEIERIFKRYCMEHEGNFFAVHEIVCRVKK